MKSGLDGRNNYAESDQPGLGNVVVSMKSGLDGRNNAAVADRAPLTFSVSMKSGLDGRNNCLAGSLHSGIKCRLNEVRPRWPEQSLSTILP